MQAAEFPGYQREIPALRFAAAGMTEDGGGGFRLYASLWPERRNIVEGDSGFRFMAPE